jgi:hypothetical protein
MIDKAQYRLEWKLHPTCRTGTILYTVNSFGMSDQDEGSEEFEIGWSIHFEPDGKFSVFEDDGKGNGVHAGTFASLNGAIFYAEDTNDCLGEGI